MRRTTQAEAHRRPCRAVERGSDASRLDSGATVELPYGRVHAHRIAALSNRRGRTTRTENAQKVKETIWLVSFKFTHIVSFQNSQANLNQDSVPLVYLHLELRIHLMHGTTVGRSGPRIV